MSKITHGSRFLIGMEHLFTGGEVPDGSNRGQVSLAEANARKLYMAMTRAGQHLVLVCSPPLPAIIE